MDDKVKAIQTRLRATFGSAMAAGRRFEGIPLVAFDEVAGLPDGGEHLVADVTRVLKARGWRVANVRRVAEVAQAAEGAALLAAAGSDITVIAAPGRVTVSRPVAEGEELDELTSVVADGFDIVLGENFGFASVPRILVTRRVQEGFNLGLPNVVAYVSNNALDVVIPRFSPTEAEAVADFIERTLGLDGARANVEE